MFTLLCLLVLGMPACDSGGSIAEFAWDKNGWGLAYIADQDQVKVFELYLSVPDGSANTNASGSLVPGGNVYKFAWTR